MGQFDSNIANFLTLCYFNIMKIAFTGGGTLGHIYPALSIYDYINSQTDIYDYIWIGRVDNREKSLVEENGIKFYSIQCGKLRRYFSVQNCIDFFKVFLGYIQAKKILKKEKPDLLFSKGGYVSVPVVYAAKKLNIKIITHESDISLGLATKLNSKVADLVFKGFLLNEEEKKNKKYLYSGNPLRKDLLYFKELDLYCYEKAIENGENLEYKEYIKPVINQMNLKFDKSKKTILVVGGSLGALEINNLIDQNLDSLLKKYNIYHQMGEKTFREKDVNGYICTKYIDKELGYLYRKADLIITRCGANTLNEEIAFEKNILGIPLKNSSSRGEQVLNAEFYKDLNLLEVYTNSMNFIDTIENLFDNEVIERRLVAFSHLKSVNANEIIYRKINELLGN